MSKRFQYNRSWYDTITRVFTKAPDLNAPPVFDENDVAYILDVISGQLSLRLLDETNLSSIPSGNSPLGYLSGARLSFVDTETVTLGTATLDSAARNHDNTFDLIWNGLLTIDITVSGINGLRAALTEANDTWYAVFAIGTTSNLTTGTNTAVAANKLIDTTKDFTDVGLGVRVGDLVINTSNQTSALVTVIDSGTQLALDTDIFTFITSLGEGEGYRIIRQTAGFLDTSTTPTLPGGYDKYRRLGWVRNDSSGDFLKFIEAMGEVQYDVERGNVQVLTGGNATAFTDIDCSSFVPETSNNITLHNDYDPQATGNSYRLRPDGSSVAAPVHNFSAVAAGTADNNFNICTFNQIIEYEVDSANDDLDVFIIGYKDDL